MNLQCDVQIAAMFSSRSQQVRVATETWFGTQAYCLSCTQTYELKSSGRIENRRIVDGAYDAMIERIQSNDPPTLVLLRYIRNAATGSEPWRIDRLMAIHPVFLTKAIVELRKPLSATARRAGWQGCNLRIDRVPKDGRILLVDNGNVASPKDVRALYESSKRMLAVPSDARGWTAMVLQIVRDIGRATFTLSEAYALRSGLEEAFPNNRHVDAKIRQQLQVLRDLGYVRFSRRGVYEVTG
jgi:type II restriction enzyme